MSLKSINPTQTSAWKNLQHHFESIKDEHMVSWFNADSDRASKMNIKWEDFFLDFSKNRITPQTLKLLKDLAEEIQLDDAISKYFDGEKINKTEVRAVLHTALRAPEDAEVFYEGNNVIPEIYEVKNKIRQFSQEVIEGGRKGFTNKAFTDM